MPAPSVAEIANVRQDRRGTAIRETPWPSRPLDAKQWERFGSYRHLAEKKAAWWAREWGRPDLEGRFLDEAYAQLLDACLRYDESRQANFIRLVRWGLTRACRRCRAFARGTGKPLQEVEEGRDCVKLGTVSVMANVPARPESSPEDGDLDAILARLTPREAEVVQAIYLEGLTQAEAARRLGIIPKRVFDALASARKKLEAA